MMIDFTKEKSVIIKKIHYQQKHINKGKWGSPHAKIINQIEHVLIEKDKEKYRSYLGRNRDETLNM